MHSAGNSNAGNGDGYVHNQHYVRHQEKFQTETENESENLQELAKYKHSVRLTLESGNKDASAWLMKFRKSTLAWRAAIETLNSNDASTGAKLFAAQVLSYKSRRGPPANDPARLDLMQVGNQVRQSMIEIFVTYSSVKDYNAPILKQLSAAFTAQVARWPAVYNYVKTIDEIIANFPPVGVAFFLSALPEISTNRGAAGLPPLTRIDYHRYLRMKISDIHDFYIALAAKHTDDNAGSIALKELAIRGFNAYVITHCAPGTFLASCNLLKGCVDILCTSSDETLVQASSEFIMSVAESIEEPVAEKKKRKESRDGSDYSVLDKEFFTQQNLEHLIQALFDIIGSSLSSSFVQLASRIQSKSSSTLGNNLVNNMNHGTNVDTDNFKLRRYVDLLCHLCNILVPVSLKKINDKSVAVELLKPLLTVLMQATMNSNWEVVRPTLFAWQTVGDFSYTSSGDFNPVEIVIEKLTEIIIYAAIYTKDYESIYDEMQREEFHDYRNDVRDTLRYFCAPQRRPRTFEQTVNIAIKDCLEMLQNLDASGNQWRKLEASLHAVGALNKFCKDDNAALTPLMEALCQLFPHLPQLHGAHCSAVVLVGQMSLWLNANPKYIEVSMSIVLRSLRSPIQLDPHYPLQLKQNHVGSIAFEKIGRDCGNIISTRNPNLFVSLCKDLWSEQREVVLDNKQDTLMVLNGLCFIASHVQNAAILQSRVERMLLEPLIPVFNAVGRPDASQTNISSNDLMFACSCLQVIFTSYKPSAYTAPDGVERGWHSLLLIEKYGQNVFALLSYDNKNFSGLNADEDVKNLEEAHESLCKAIKSVWDNMKNDTHMCNDQSNLVAYVRSMVDGFGALLVKDLNTSSGQNISGYLDVFKSVLIFSVENNVAEDIVSNAVIEIVRIMLKHPRVLHELPDACIIFSDLLSIFVIAFPRFIIESNEVAKSVIEIINVGLTIRYQKSGRKMIQVAERCFLSVIPFISNNSNILEMIAPQLLYGILMAANGNMPSNVLEEIVNSFHNMWMKTSDDIMHLVLRRIMTIKTFPSAKTKDKTKEVFVTQIICDECRRSKARFKKLLKAFCGGKKKRDKMRALHRETGGSR